MDKIDFMKSYLEDLELILIATVQMLESDPKNRDWAILSLRVVINKIQPVIKKIVED